MNTKCKFGGKEHKWIIGWTCSSFQCRHCLEFHRINRNSLQLLVNESYHALLNKTFIEDSLKESRESLRKIREGKTVTVEYDLSVVETEKRLQDKLRELGWMPREDVAALTAERDSSTSTTKDNGGG